MGSLPPIMTECDTTETDPAATRHQSKREKSRDKKRRQRDRRRERARVSAIAEAETLEREMARREILDEAQAPAIMRKPIIAADGTAILGARVEVIDGKPSRIDPVARLKLTERQRRAARQLLADWREVGGGLNVRAVDYLRSGNGGDGQGAHEAMRRQIDTRARLDGAMARLGAYTVLVARVVLDCIPLDVWARQKGKTPENAMGWLEAALDRVAAFYWPATPDSTHHDRILTIGPPKSAYDMSAPN